MCQSYLSYLILQYRPVESKVFDQVSLATMFQVQTKDSVMELFIQYVCKGKTERLRNFQNQLQSST